MNFMKLSSYRYVQISHIILAIFIVICIFVDPRYFFTRNQGGISNYGTDSRTQIFFILGFLAAAIGTWLAAFTHKNISKFHKYIMIAIGIMYFLLMLSTIPYKLNSTFKTLHFAAALALFLTMLMMTFWIKYKLAKNSRVIKVWFYIFLLGLIIALLTQLKIITLLFVSQIVVGVAFAVILIYSLKLPKQS